MRKSRVMMLVAVLSAAVLVPTGEANAALNAYLKLKGVKQGDIKGSVVQKGREGAIKVISFNHEIVSPRDPASGLPTGKRQHKPLMLTVEVDRSTPQLISAMVNNEKLGEFSIDVGAPGSGATQYRVKLTNASISAFEFVTLADKDTTALRLSFTYQKIEWTWVPDGIMAMDDWEAPVAAKKL
jgi:type VI secretion system secreted protein Hcp